MRFGLGRLCTDDFRTLNRCLDDAIAAAVTEFGREEDISHAGESQELRTLTDTAITASPRQPKDAASTTTC
jgi:hypothetical protein